MTAKAVWSETEIFEFIDFRGRVFLALGGLSGWKWYLALTRCF